jgi:hypothetical protein
VERPFSRVERRELRRLANEAYARELDGALRDLASAFTDWRKGRVDGFSLARTIHEFHDGIARVLWSRYEQLPPEVAVRLAVESGILRPAELPGELRAKLGVHPTT